MDLKELLGGDDTTYDQLEIWGKTLYFGSLSAAEIYDYYEGVDATKDTPGRRTNGIRLVARSLVDGIPPAVETPTRLAATHDELEATVQMLLKKNPKKVGELVQFVLKLNGIEIKEDKNVGKEDAKNDSGGAPSADSPTSSR